MDQKTAQELINQTKKFYDSVAEHFSRTRSFNWPELKPLIDKYIKSGDKILDLGCGNGRLLELLKDKGVEYIGVDNSRALIKIAQERYNKIPNVEYRFVVADALDLSFPENSFDAVISLAVLHHIPSVEKRKKFFREVKRVLKPEGILILTVWNLWQNPKALKLLIKYTFLKLFRKSDLDFFDIFYPWKDKSGNIVAYRYLHFFRRNELKKLARSSGFQVSESGILPRGKKYSNIYLVARNLGNE
jgi:alkylated DNA repair protein alkB family protein 8